MWLLHQSLQHVRDNSEVLTGTVQECVDNGAGRGVPPAGSFPQRLPCAGTCDCAVTAGDACVPPPCPRSTSIKYSHCGDTDGSRLLAVCDVALGRCVDLQRRDLSLTAAPPGYDSVHGVPGTAAAPTDFEVRVSGGRVLPARPGG